MATKFPRLNQALNALGREAVARARNILQNGGKDDTGNLSSSINYEVLDDNTVIIYSDAEYADNVEYGRRPGKFPPIDALAPWARRKGIPESALFPIARKIARDGIDPFPFINPTADWILNQMDSERIIDAFLKDTEDQLDI